jgi:hypothetical protein
LFYLAYVFLSDRRLVVQPRRWWRLAIAVPVGVVPYLYLPIRGAMDAPLAPPRLDTLQGFLNHALARGFAGDMFAYANARDLPHRMSLIPTLFRFQFGAALVLVALLSLVLLAWRDWKLGGLLAGSLVVHTFVTITYRAPQTVEYLMPAAYPVIGIAVGLFPAVLGAWRRDIRPRAPGTAEAFVSACVIVAGGLNGWAHAPSFVELAGDRTARDAVSPLLDEAPGGALVLSDWHWVTPLWYLQQVEGVRADVEVRYVYNVAGEHYRQTWRRRVEDTPSDRPLLLTHYYDFGGYTAEPFASGVLVRERPATEPQADLTPVDATFGGSIRVLGYSLRPPEPRVGQSVEMTLAWQPLGEIDRPVSLSARLTRDGEDRVSQADRALQQDVSPGEVRFERVVLPLYPSLAPREYVLTLGAYSSSGAGFEELSTEAGATTVPLGQIRLLPARAGYSRHACHIPFQGGTDLVGVSYDRSVSGTLRVYVRWKGPVSQAVVATLQAPGGNALSAQLPAVPDGAYQTILFDLTEPVAGGLKLSLAVAGRPLAIAGPWGLRRGSAPLPRPAPDAVFIPLGEDIAVVGAAARLAQPGGEALIEARLAGLRPLTSDYAISIRLTDEDGRWLARHDWQPALGAIPTLKWIRGSQVVDRHMLPVPGDFVGISVRAELVAYERFREAPLPSMDGRFGQAPLGAWPVPGAADGS